MSKYISTKKKEQDKVNISEWFRISVWVTKRIFSFNPVYATGYLFASIFSGLRSILDTYVLAKIIDSAVNMAQQKTVVWTEIYSLVGFLVVISIFLTVMEFVSNYFRNNLDRTTAPYLRQMIFTKINQLDIQTIEDPENANLINRANRSVTGIPGYFKKLMRMVSQLSGVVTTAGVVLSFMPTMVPIILVVTIPKYLIDKKYRGKLWKFSMDTTEARRKANTSAEQISDTSMLPEIFINNSFSLFNKKYMDFKLWFSDRMKKLNKQWLSSVYALSIFEMLPIYYGFIKILENLMAHAISTGTVYFQLEMLRSFKTNLVRTYMDYNALFEWALRIRDPYRLLQLERAFPDGTQKLEVLETGPEIKLTGVNFRYPQGKSDVINGIDLIIHPNEKIAIVGANGAGKTTLIKLICRMYPVIRGKITINKTNIADVTRKSLYKNIGILFQDFNRHPQLTVKENIVVGNPHRKYQKTNLVESTESADALEFIEKLPNKWHQILGQSYEEGTRLSTGQWQKLAIARFFYRNAPLVIFDEPTASIDAVSEYNIFNKIYGSFENKTVIIISHRFSTVRNADRIIVMEEGKIIEQGTHQELLKLNGHYAYSFKLQAEGYSQS